VAGPDLKDDLDARSRAEAAEQVEELEEEVEQAVPAPVARGPRRLNLVGYRNWYFAFSLVIILPGLFFMFTRGFLYGVDFAGGTQLTVTFDHPVALATVQSAVASQSPGSSVQPGPQGRYLIRTAFLDPVGIKRFEDKLAQQVGAQVTLLDQQSVGGVIARETVLNALLAIVLAAILILFYLAFRFRRVQGGWRSGFQFGGSALLALLHDVALLTGIFSILGKGFGLPIGQIDSLFVTAVLTMVGFSVHDTIVVFDRIRENMIVSQRLSFEQIVNLSIMQTAARSIITSFLVVLVLLALLLAGGDTLRGFILALLIGIVSGTYSSIFNAAPLLVVWRRSQPARVYWRPSQVRGVR
jgi:preprotein translocase subunit SecF